MQLKIKAIFKKVNDYGDLDLVDESVEEREAAAFAVLDPVGGRGWGRLLDHLVGEAPDGAQEESKWPETEAHLEQGPASKMIPTLHLFGSSFPG